MSSPRKIRVPVTEIAAGDRIADWTDAPRVLAVEVLVTLPDCTLRYPADRTLEVLRERRSHGRVG